MYYVDLQEFLRNTIEADIPFGEICVLLAGNFKQTLHIVRRANQLIQVNSCIRSSDYIWNLFKDNQYSRTKNMRVEIKESEEAIEKMKYFMFLRCIGTCFLLPNAESNITLSEEMVESEFEAETKIQDMVTDYI